MALEVGIVGLPNAGKTTLFNALTHAGAEITAYASAAAKPNVGMAMIPDERLEPVARVEDLLDRGDRGVDARGLCRQPAHQRIDQTWRQHADQGDGQIKRPGKGNARPIACQAAGDDAGGLLGGHHQRHPENVSREHA